jgi:hypothetical protein
VQRLRDAIRAQAGMVDRTLGQPRFAIITSFNLADYTARVKLQPEGTLTGWLPVLSPWTGSGWGMVCPLAAGDQVLVLPQEGDTEHGVVVGRAYSKASPPPQAAAGELWIVHASGCCLKLKADGTVSITGDLHVLGDVYDRHGPLSRLRDIYNAHTHRVPSGGNTSTPEVTD